MHLDFFSPKTPPLIGVDISSSSIKVVELARGKAGLTLCGYAIEGLPDTAVVDGIVCDADALASALTNCRRKLRTKVRGVAAALPSSMVVMKTLRTAVRGVSEEEIESAVAIVMADHISFPIDDASIDFVVGAIDPATGEAAVTAAAASRERVAERVNAIESSGLQVVVVDSEALALLDTVDQYMVRAGVRKEDSNVLMVNIGHHTTEFSFLRNGEVLLHRDQPFGTSTMVRDIQDCFGVDVDHAHKLLSGAKAADDPGALAAVGASFAEAAAQEARRAVQMFTTTTHHTSIDAVLVCGDVAAIPGILDAIRNDLAVPARILDPFDGMAIAEGIDRAQLAKDSPSLVLACGLAMRRFDR